MRMSVFWSFAGFSLLFLSGCATQDSVIRGQAPCPSGICNHGHGSSYDPNGLACSQDDCLFTDKWSQSNVHHQYHSLVPQAGHGVSMPVMIQYPYYTLKGPDCFFYDE